MHALCSLDSSPDQDTRMLFGFCPGAARYETVKTMRSAMSSTASPGAGKGNTSMLSMPTPPCSQFSGNPEYRRRPSRERTYASFLMGSRIWKDVCQLMMSAKFQSCSLA